MNSRHIVFVAPPAPGHVYPTLALVEHLITRGHRVTYITSPALSPMVSATGAEVAELDWVQDTSDLADREFTAEVFVATLEEFLAASRAALPGLLDRFRSDAPDLVCADAVVLGPLLAGAFDVPLMSLVPNFASNEHFSPAHLIPGFDPAGPLFTAYGAKVARLFADYQVPMGGPAAGLTLVFLPRAFQIAGDTFGAGHRFIGPSLSRARAAAWQPPADGAPVLLVSLGTAFNNRPEFFAACVEAFRDTRWHVVMSVGQHVDLTTIGHVPTNVDIAAHVPQPTVLQHATAFITHAGMGSVMEALYHQVPILAAPQVHEQSLNADRITELGLGHRLDTSTPTPAELHGRIERLAGDAMIRANLAAMREAIQSAGGAIAGAEAIEHLLSE
ncbi:MGT family glycosyltransferase [Prauserella sediminis]|uniref:MGT family glycosyltransferase n=1 Tax=Prauserella sediminis TaxID=577680 RepID=A0A839XYW7_9PSEU|nr:macrolide family glycosyltransferase [Prauserella sediminis]MBB3665216.1 MGT family glycosyltransferase [Prauserella sediminis]